MNPGGHRRHVARGLAGGVGTVVGKDGNLARPFNGVGVRVAVGEAPENLVAVGKAVVDAGGFGVVPAAVGSGTEPVRRHQRVVVVGGERSQRKQVLGHGTFARDGDLVIGEGLAHPGFGVGGPRVIERIAASLAVNQPAEIPLAHGRGRHSGAGGGARHVAIRLVGEEEEGAVLAVIDFRQVNRPAERRAEFVAHQVRRLLVVVLAGAGHAEAVVARGFKSGAVHLVCAALRGDQGGGRAAHFGAGVTRFHAEFLNGIDARRARADAAAAAVGVRQHRAVLHILHGPSQTVHLGALQPGRGRRHQVIEEAAVERQLFDPLPLEHVAERGRRGGHQRSDIANHRDLRGCHRHVERRLDGGRLSRLQQQLALPRLHAGSFGLDGVLARLQGGENIEADLVRFGAEFPRGLRVRDRYPGARQHGAAGVAHYALNASRAGLREGLVLKKQCRKENCERAMTEVHSKSSMPRTTLRGAGPRPAAASQAAPKSRVCATAGPSLFPPAQRPFPLRDPHSRNEWSRGRPERPPQAEGLPHKYVSRLRPFLQHLLTADLFNHHVVPPALALAVMLQRDRPPLVRSRLDDHVEDDLPPSVRSGKRFRAHPRHRGGILRP